ncbi:YwqG family protein [Wielerella bovis]|uniref:YwqG family protein n=1 Tax=Wielerella bovis TaxID=2917790 RepID=UPI00201A08F0|nr:DUF1963 domain-containing protein [Wielerella bovis]MCG7657783.1 DUF1963 domain-containing protein [Wielerella bovis]MCG7660005.1 DUF1963 domain-containing protein [Wielerella bovis]
MNTSTQLLREKLPQNIAEKIIATAQPTLRYKLEKAQDFPQTASRVGGVGYWASERDYPRNAQGKPLALLAQINLAELPQGAAAVLGLPETGLLAFYFDAFDDLAGMNLDNVRDTSGNRCVYFTDVSAPSLSRETLLAMFPADSYSYENQSDNDEINHGANLCDLVALFGDNPNMSPEQAQQAVFQFLGLDPNALPEKSTSNQAHQEELLLPFWGEYRLIFQEVSEQYATTYCVESQQAQTHLFDILADLNFDEDEVFELEEQINPYHDANRLRGYPQFSQGDPREDDDTLSESVLLFQLTSCQDSDDNTAVMWGDGGECQFFIDKADLAAQRFDKAWFYWAN